VHQSCPSRGSAFIGAKPGDFGRSLLTQNNLADRMGLSRRRTVQVSALSTFDGSVRDYHGCDG
jgi:hypothetical protein